MGTWFCRLLQEAVVTPGWVSTDEFLGGYGAAQALPGPLFSIARISRRATRTRGRADVLGASVALDRDIPSRISSGGGCAACSGEDSSLSPIAFRAIAGVNAAVVGVLAAAFYDPVWKSAVIDWIDIGNRARWDSSR